jgi:hypothetical protein
MFATARPALRVALPTYSATVRGIEMRVEPDDVAAFLHALESKPIAGVGGIVWFRLPVDGDAQTWSRGTFARVVAPRRGDHVAPSAIGPKLELVAQGEGRFDVVVSNAGPMTVELPAVHVTGEIREADMVMGYRADGPGRWEAPHRSLARNERIVIGWIHGKDLSLVD